jgi:glucose-6-phosphate isomerase
MQLPDEAIRYDYQGMLAQPGEAWTAEAELRARHCLAPARLKEIEPRLLQCRSLAAAEREMKNAPAGSEAPQAGFIDLPQQLLDDHRRKGEESRLGHVLRLAARLRDETDRVVVVGIGGSYLGSRAVFDALRSIYHNELPRETRLGSPRIYFEGISPDNDAVADLLELLQVRCVDPNERDERWGLIVISKSGETLEPAVALRILRREAAEYYGSRSDRLKQLFVAVTGAKGALRELFRAQGHEEKDMPVIPDNVGGRYSVFTPVGLLPAAVMGLDVSALLLGAAAMTRRFLEEPFDRNPVLQYAAVNYLMYAECDKPVRVLSAWSRKLESLSMWYDQLLAESLGKQGRGPTPLTTVQTRDLHSRGQQHQEGPRDRVINNLVVRSSPETPLAVGMADHNQDDLNRYCRKTLPMIMRAALEGTNAAYHGVARPTADIVLPTLSEHTLGQLMQMLMLATVVEGKLLGINPYGQPGVQAYKEWTRGVLDRAE